MANCNCNCNWKSWLRCIWLGLLIGAAVGLTAPYMGGVYYSMCGNREDEQAYLDKCIGHLKLMRVHCDDLDLQDILDYTTHRYCRVGAWDVMFMPANDPVIGRDGTVLGCNCPWCPGITIDTRCLLLPPEETALIMVHEALHDYYPYLGHAHINDRETKLYEVSDALRRLH